MQIRPAFGGNIIATIVNPRTRPLMATVREGVMRIPQPDAARNGEVLTLDPALDAQDGKVTIVERTRVEKKVNLKSASIIVAGGAGVGNRERFGLIFTLASCLGASVGATRAAVDGGLIHRDHQVGQTGTTVRPRLYIACGISGAVVFFNTDGHRFSDVGLYVKNDTFIHAPSRHTGKVVVSNLNNRYWKRRFTGARRPGSH